MTYLVISSDGHVGPPPDVLREYFEPGFRTRYDEYVAAKEARKAAIWAALPAASFSDRASGAEPEKALAAHPSLQPGGNPALWDPRLRIGEVEQDGIVGEVLFPDFPHIVSNEPPFGLVSGGHKEADGGINRRSHELYEPELQWSGARAYNRWLADFCATHPDRYAGIAIVPFLDVEEAVAEIRWARDAGLRGGILLPGMNVGLRYNDSSYEPIWSTLEELEMPLNTHGGLEVPDYGPDFDALPLMQSEFGFFCRRPLWWLYWSGVFERHAGLVLVFSEQMADWVPSTVAELDEQYEASPHVRAALSLKPSEVWERQCFVGATFMTRAEAEARFDIGLRKIMWGSDYPHPEGTWPYTRECLRRCYADLPAGEVQMMVGDNAARVYGFDLDRLAPLAARIGPRIQDVMEPLTEIPPGYIGAAMR